MAFTFCASKLTRNNAFWGLFNTRFLTMRSPCGGIFCRALFSSNPKVLEKDAIFTPLTPNDISPKSDDILAGRKWLPGAQGKGFPELLAKPYKDFPHALQLKSSDQYNSHQLAQVCRKIIDKDLANYGAILFRGLPFPTAEKYTEFVTELGYESMNYTGGSANRKLVNQKANVYTANDDPSAYTIELHNELAYAPVYPRKLIFFCLEQPGDDCGGYTVLCDSRKFLAKLNPDIVKKIEEKQVRYWYRVPHQGNTDYISWQTMFVTEDKKKVEDFLVKDGFDFSWNSKDDSLEYWITRPAFLNHPETGEKRWFNHIHRKHISDFKESPMFPGEAEIDRIYLYSSTYGDGSAVELEVIQHVRATSWECTIGFQWKQGDVLFVDNLLAMHGRLGFTGKRKILANLLAD